MSAFNFSEKQKAVIRFGREDGFSCLLQGWVRSGKSHATLAAFGVHILSLTEPFEHLILGKNTDTLDSSTITPLIRFVEGLGARVHLQKHKNRVTINNQLIWLRGAENNHSDRILMGLNIHSGLFEEVALIPEPVFNAAWSRFSGPGNKKCWLSCNPEGPSNFIKTKMDSGFFDRVYSFNFDDNPTLTKADRDRLNSSFHGTFHRRKCMGLWESLSGRVFDEWKVVGNIPTKLKKVGIGIDPGNGVETGITVLGEGENGRFYFVEEETLKGKHTDDQIVAVVTDLAKKYDAEIAVCDSAASSTLQSLRELPNRSFKIKKADKRIMHGVRLLGTTFASEKLCIHQRCKKLINQLENYTWGTNERPQKKFDHQIDGGRYIAAEMIGKPKRRKPIPLPQKFINR